MRRDLYVFAIVVVMQISCAVSIPPAQASTHTQMVTSTPEISASPPVPLDSALSYTTAMVTAVRSLHVREEPGHDTPISGYLWNDDFVVMTGNCLNGWAEIRWNLGTAWVNSYYLSENKCWKK